ncbi:MAG: secretin N-terminal domain-containing protein [Verrucomicrobiota bacterium]
MTSKIVLPSLALSLACAALCPSALAQDNPPTPAVAAPTVEATNTRTRSGRPGLTFNFRGAPLETVLNYMSEAAGFVIVLESPVRGTVDMWSTQPVSREEAVQLLNLALNKNGYTATAQGRNLIVSTKDDAKKRNIQIRTGNDPQEIPETAEMVMQIIPLRRIDAGQAAIDLATLLPSTATITANADSNSLVVTDTNINVRHIVTLVAALDGSSDSSSAMKIFKLENADPVEMAALLTNIFQGPTSSSGGGAAGQIAQMLAARGSQKSNKRSSTSSRSGGGGSSGARSTPIMAVADPRTFSVIVTASKEEMPEIAEIVAQLDSSTARKQRVYVYTLENADVRQVETVLKNLFQSSTQRATTSTNTADPLATRASSNTQTAGPNIQLGTARAGGR